MANLTQIQNNKRASNTLQGFAGVILASVYLAAGWFDALIWHCCPSIKHLQRAIRFNRITSDRIWVQDIAHHVPTVKIWLLCRDFACQSLRTNIFQDIEMHPTQASTGIFKLAGDTLKRQLIIEMKKAPSSIGECVSQGLQPRHTSDWEGFFGKALPDPEGERQMELKVLYQESTIPVN